MAEPVTDPHAELAQSHIRRSATYPMIGAFGDDVNLPRLLAEALYVEGVHRYSAGGRLEHHLTVEQVTEVSGAADTLRWEIDTRDATWRGCLTSEDGSWMMYCCSTPGRHGTVTVYGNAKASVQALVKSLQEASGAGAPEPVEGKITVDFHFLGNRGVSTRRRPIEAPEWGDIAANYTATARKELERLMAVTDPGTGGRLVLLHGEPGTGKTTAIRALARQWSGWCGTSYVLDPETLFGSAGYTHELLLNRSESDDEIDSDEDKNRWRLVVIEDADEIISANARSRVGQSLGRLLNVTDGMLGQGLRTIVLITTNEPIHALHPALTRPGRCLANIEVGRLTSTEARELVCAEQRPAVPDDGVTLAQLFELRRSGVTVAAETASSRPGLYL